VNNRHQVCRKFKWCNMREKDERRKSLSQSECCKVTIKRKQVTAYIKMMCYDQSVKF